MKPNLEDNDGRPETDAEALRRELEEMAKAEGVDVDTLLRCIAHAANAWAMERLGIKPLDL
jgi:hypothetical protein